MGRPKPPEHDNRDDERRGRPKNLELRLVKATELSACNLGAMSDGIAHVINRLSRIADALEGSTTPPPQGEGHTTIHVVAVELENQETETMPTPDRSPDFSLPSSATQAVLAVVGPKKADGSYATNGGFTTSDETTLPVEAIADSFYQQPDPAWVDPGDGSTAPLIDVLDEAGNQIPVYKCRAKTPLEPEPGQKVFGDVTWKGPGMVDAVVKVEYGDPALGHAVITGSVENEV